MPLSYTTAEEVGVGDTIAIPYPFLSTDHVFVSVDGVAVSSSLYTWSSASQIEALTGFPAGALTKVYRQTPSSSLGATLSGTAVYDSAALQTNFTQLLYILQERVDQDVLDATEVADILASIGGVEAAAAAAAASALAAATSATTASDAVEDIEGFAPLDSPDFVGGPKLPYGTILKRHPSVDAYGAALQFQAGNTSPLGGDMVLDVVDGKFRGFETAGTQKGFFIDITRCGTGASEEVALLKDVTVAGGANFVTSIAALKAVDYTEVSSVLVVDPLRGGVFTWVALDYSGWPEDYDSVFIVSNLAPKTTGVWVRQGFGVSRLLRPEWFGAKRDGGTDDSVAFQRMTTFALNSAGSSGWIFRLGSGTYYISGGWHVVWSNSIGTHVIGEGIDNTVIMVGAASTLGIRFGYAADGSTAFRCSAKGFTVTRVGDTVPDGSIGLFADDFNYFTEFDVRVDRFAIARYTGGASIQYEAWGPYTSNIKSTDWYLAGAAQIRVHGGEMGQNGGELFDRESIVTITGDCNDVLFEGVEMIPRGPGALKPSVIRFVNYTNTTGVLHFVNCNTENVRYGVTSDAGTALVNELVITGGRWAVEVGMFLLNAATRLQFSWFQFNTPQTVILEKVGTAVTFSFCHIGSTFSLQADGSGSPSITVIGCSKTPTLYGTWASQVVASNHA